MYKISGTETDIHQGITILHDEVHEGLLRIQLENSTTPDFSIQTTSYSTILSGNELVLDFKKIKINNIGDSDNNVITISKNGTLSVTQTYEWIYFMIGMVVSFIAYYK